MPSATLQAKIAAFESLAHHSHSVSPSTTVTLSSNPLIDDTANLLETPISPTTAHALPPAVQLTVVNTRKQPPPQVSPSPSPPNLGRKTSLIDLKDWIVEDEFSESSHGVHRPPPRIARNGHHEGGMKPLSNGATAHQVSQAVPPLISLESPPKVKPKPKHLISKPITADFDTPTVLPPQLKSVASSSSLRSSSTSHLYPPRRNNSVAVDGGRTSPPKLGGDFRLKTSSGHVPTSSMSSFHSVSLSSDSSTPLPLELDQERDLSVKSYGSDSVSLSESYEEVSSSAVASPVTERLINLDWERASAQRNNLTPTLPPKLPQRPTLPSTGTKPPPPRPPPQTNSRSMPSSPIIRSSSSLTSAPPLTVNSTSPRRAPPLPSRSSDRSSIWSNTTSDSNFSVNYPTYQPSQSKPAPLSQTPTIVQPNNIQKTRRPTPIPPKARKRYENLFNANVLQHRRAEKQRKDKPALLSPAEARRSRQGWRGLSIDLTTTEAELPMANNAKQMQDDNDEPNDMVIDNDDVLEGCIARCIWMRSGLGKARLRVIWNECDTGKKGVLDRESFVRGMWRIDEELRRAQTEPLKSARNKIPPH